MTKLSKILVVTLIIQAIILAYLIGRWQVWHSLLPTDTPPKQINTQTA